MGWQDAPVVEAPTGSGQPAWMGAPEVAADEKASMADTIAGLPITRLAMGAASPLIASAQLGAHLGDKLNEAMGVKPMVSPWIDKQLALYEAMKQRGMKAANNEGFDWMGLLGSLAPGAAVAKGVTAALPAATSAAGRIGTGAAIGGMTAAAQPVADTPNFWTEKAKQVGLGTAVGAAVPAIGTVLQAGKAAIEPFYDQGRNAIIGRTLNKASGGEQQTVVNALAKAGQIVPGSEPTVAQASGNAGIASLERAASAIDPSVTVAFQGREAAQNAARLKALGSVAGDENLMAQAIKDRAKASGGLLQQVTASTAEVNPGRTVNLIDRIIDKSPGRSQLTNTLENVKKSLFEPYPLEQRGKEAWDSFNMLAKGRFGLNDTEAISTARTVMDRVKKGTIDAETALDQLKGLTGVNPKVSDAISSAKDLLKASDQRLRSNASELYQGARKNITDLLNAKAGDGSKVNEAISRELSVVMKSLDHQINKVEPAYGKYLSTYADMSKPLNRMEVGQKIQEKAINKLTDVLQPNAYANALSDKTAQQATGFKRATLEGTMTPAQLKTLQAIKDDLSRAVIARNAGGTVGSDTVKKLAYSNLIDRAGVPTFLREFAPTQVVGNILARGADSIYGSANKEISNQLAMTLLDPKKAALVMQQVGPSRYAALIDAVTQQGAGAAGTTAGRMSQP